MKTSQAGMAALAALPQWTFAAHAETSKLLAARGLEPLMPYDPSTIQTCTGWYDNYLDLSCTDVRDLMYAISPADFSRWNPSITINCGNWQWLSYCVQVESEQIRTTLTSSATSTTATITSTTSAPAKPTLLGWETLGCYIDEDNPHTLSDKSTKEGGSLLTVDKCQAACFVDDYFYAGVKAGMECWCGTWVSNEWTSNQKDCNVPCGGQSSQICGGVNVMNIYKAQLKDTLPTPSTTDSVTTTTTTTTTTNLQPEGQEGNELGQGEEKSEGSRLFDARGRRWLIVAWGISMGLHSLTLSLDFI